MFKRALIGLMLLSSPQVRADSIHTEIDAKASALGVPLAFAHAVFKAESNYKPNAHKKGNYGLGQIRCVAAREQGYAGDCKQLMDPKTNIHYSLLIMKAALEQSHNDICHAATLYNHGFYTRKRNSRFCQKIKRLMR